MSEQTAAYLSRKATAHYLTHAIGISCSISLLNKLARTGEGPEFIRPGQGRYGRTFYSKEAIEDWLARVDPKRRAA